MIQLGSSLRGLGRPEEAVAVLTAVTADRPESVAAQLFLSLALLDADRPAEAVRGLVESTLAHSGDPDVVAYRTALLSSAAALSRT
jgi:predicted Zn-dependent protease